MDPTLLGVIIGVLSSTLSTALVAFITVRIAGKQMRHNQEEANKAAQERQDNLLTNSFDDLITERRSIVLAGLNDPIVCTWILNRFKLTPPPEEQRLYVLALLQADHYEHIFYRYWHGLFPEELWPQWQKSMANTFPSPEFLTIMKSPFRYVLSDGFWAYYESMFPLDIRPHDPRFSSEAGRMLSREVLPLWTNIVESKDQS
jgi:hypothetical protein